MENDIFFSVGEPSGDLHAANLIEELATLAPGVRCRGFGGRRMAAAGCAIDFDLTQLAVVGIVEVLPKLREFFRVADQAEAIFRSDPPRAVVLVDFPGFNWHIAKRAKKYGIPVIYYLPPQLWAWGAWRLKKMRRTVDRVLCNLPFEPAWYAERGMQVEYVGHPFFDEVAARELDRRFLEQWSSPPSSQRAHAQVEAAQVEVSQVEVSQVEVSQVEVSQVEVSQVEAAQVEAAQVEAAQVEVAHGVGLQVAVLPGSRSREVEKIWPMQLEVIRRLGRRYPHTRFLVAAYRDSQCLACRRWLTADDADLNIEFFVGKTSEIIHVADCALMKSGSSSLELMARGTPAVVVYHVSRSLYAIGRCLSKVRSMTLPNMIAGEAVMPEFLAVGSTRRVVEQVTAELDRMLGDADYRERRRQQLRELAARYARTGASRRAAECIAEYLPVAAREGSSVAPHGDFTGLRNRDSGGEHDHGIEHQLRHVGGTRLSRHQHRRVVG
jgi:lipid-A-disaccharide synthase